MSRLAFIAASALLVAGTAYADHMPAAQADKAVAFYDKVFDAAKAAGGDCAKFAASLQTLIKPNLPLLRALKKANDEGKTLPPDAEAKIEKRASTDAQDLGKCVEDKAVLAALERIADPDKPAPPPPPSPADLAAVKPPVAADLDEYTKGIAGTGDLIATISTPLGAVKCQLHPEKAPITVANFVGLATGKKPYIHPKTNKLVKNKPYYNGVIFHRVIPDFMIQGGDPLGTGTGGPGYTFADETNDLKMVPGALAMANAGPATNGSQFFVNDGSPTYLEGKHTIFGTCKPLDVVAKIARTKTASGDKPVKPVTMKIAISRGKY